MGFSNPPTLDNSYMTNALGGQGGGFGNMFSVPFWALQGIQNGGDGPPGAPAPFNGGGTGPNVGLPLKSSPNVGLPPSPNPSSGGVGPNVGLPLLGGSASGGTGPNVGLPLVQTPDPTGGRTVPPAMQAVIAAQQGASSAQTNPTVGPQTPLPPTAPTPLSGPTGPQSPVAQPPAAPPTVWGPQTLPPQPTTGGNAYAG